MKASGLTVGGFYKHFRSKDDLLVQAIEEGMSDFGRQLFEATKHARPGQRWKEIVKWYLSMDHCERSDTGCPMATLAPEIARAAPAVKKRILNTMKARRERMLEFMPGRNAAERAQVEIQTAVATRISPLLVEFLASDELRQQVVVLQVERIEPIKTFMGIKVVAASRNQVKHGLVQDCDGEFYGEHLSLVSADVQIDRGCLSRFVHLLVRINGDAEFLVGILDQRARIAHAEGGLAEINLVVPQGILDPR